MKNILLFTTDEEKLSAFVTHIQSTYGYTPALFTSIDWTGVTPKDSTTTAYTLEDSTDVQDYLRQQEIYSIYLDGNSYIRVSIDTPTAEDYLYGINKLLKDKAVSYGYDDIVSACSYATSTNPQYQTEGQAFVAWRDAIWEDFYTKMDQAKNTGNWPDPQVLIDSLPTFTV